VYFFVEEREKATGIPRPCAFGTEENNMATLYETIDKLCQERGIRPGRLCADLGISRGLMTDLKMGRKKGVNAETARKIADYLGVSVGYLLGQNEPRDVLDEVDVAFYGDFKELNEQEKDAVRDMVRIMRMRRQSEE
jgi:DNA-binding Xre family transcriptional regulator